ncbi:hypothetical protein RFI_10181 [Reticulomyxa filosa]|uniref:RING-type domain-containing protein n=1 Tax=Reticulomyxa filosa TaxID=46433 RepID=X6NL00_RETFI|nr:hypothetical protein RFI_10181 [Reticulomyxa filosa]|eukprot:ETO26955.1 hypothetical protein RFI_10181 [Reticulomyxa filosa]
MCAISKQNKKLQCKLSVEKECDIALPEDKSVCNFTAKKLYLFFEDDTNYSSIHTLRVKKKSVRIITHTHTHNKKKHHQIKYKIADSNVLLYETEKSLKEYKLKNVHLEELMRECTPYKLYESMMETQHHSNATNDDNNDNNNNTNNNNNNNNNDNNNKRSDLNRLLDQIPYCYLTPVCPMVMVLKHVNADALYKHVCTGHDHRRQVETQRKLTYHGDRLLSLVQSGLNTFRTLDLNAAKAWRPSLHLTLFVELPKVAFGIHIDRWHIYYFYNTEARTRLYRSQLRETIEDKRDRDEKTEETKSEKDREEKTNEHEQIRKHMAESLAFDLSEIEHLISSIDSSPSNDITFFDIFNCIMKDASLHIDLAQYLVTHLFHPFLEIALSSTPANNKMNGNYIKQNVLFCTTLVLKRLKEEINNLNSCAICLEEMDYKNYCRLSRCRHLYHFSCIREHLKFSGDNRCPLCRSRFEMIQARKIEDKTQKTVLELFQTNQLTENDEDDASDSNMSDILSRVERTNSLFSAINALQQRNILCQQCQHRIHISYANNRGERHGFINCALCDHFFHVRCVNPDLFIQCQECLMLSSRKFLF